MKKEEIKEGTELVQAFMGTFGIPNYHTSWDSLMLVIEKIETITKSHVTIGDHCAGYLHCYYSNINKKFESYSQSRNRSEFYAHGISASDELYRNCKKELSINRTYKTSVEQSNNDKSIVVNECNIFIFQKKKIEIIFLIVVEFIRWYNNLEK